MSDKQRYNKPFMWLIVALGTAACAVSAAHVAPRQLDLRFLLLVSVTLCFGSRIGIEFSRVKVQITVSDTFIFLVMLLYGSDLAVLLAGAEALVSSMRFSRLWLTRVFNGMLLACSTFLTCQVVAFFFGPVEQLLAERITANYVTAICLMALVQYISNTGLAAWRESFKRNETVRATWVQYYQWISITYFAGASAAGITAHLIRGSGLYAFLVTIPIISIIYFTYQTYRKHLSQAEQHAEEQSLISAALKESEEHYRNAFEHFRSSFDNASIGMALVAPEGRWLQVNKSLCDIVGYTSTELLTGNIQTIIHTDDLSQYLMDTYCLLEGQTVSTARELRYIHKAGHQLWVAAGASVVRDASGRPMHMIAQMQDITERKRAEQQLNHAAFHDVLTGLPNRALFTEHLQLAIERAKHHEAHRYAVLFLDLDRFKNINDSLGHTLGDQFLRSVAERLTKCVRPEDTIARFGGDEFALLFNGYRHSADAIHVAERIQHEFSRPFNLGGHEVFSSASIGIALSTLEYSQPDAVLRDADTAMYRAKSQGKGRFEVFDKIMHARAVALLQLEGDLRRAIERAEFELHYQPIVALADGRITGFEALVRWQHPERGLVSPGEFISVAEDTETILPIGHWVLAEACRQMREWQLYVPGGAELSISVNLSPKQFKQPDLVSRIRELLHQTGLAPASLRLEITESAVMEDAEMAVSMLKKLRALGVQLSIDDFGTGYSSLSYLHRYPATILKVDRSFVSGIDSGTDEANELVRTIVTLAHNLGMHAVAEGIETEEQRAYLSTLHCEYGQGYLFSKPVTATAAAQLINKPTGFRPPTETVEHRADVQTDEYAM